MIHEDTNHIQALDLVGRKLPMKGGRHVLPEYRKLVAIIEAGTANLMEFEVEELES